MKKTPGFLVLLNLVLLLGLALLWKSPRQTESVVVPVLPAVQPLAQTKTISLVPPPSDPEPASFRWSQLTSTKDYRLYIAKLRAIGCPEITIEDIVRGDTGRVYSWERSQLGLDGSGAGPWSRQAEMQLVDSLLSGQAAETAAVSRDTGNQVEAAGREMAQISMPSQNATAGTHSYPLFLQNANWSALGFDASQQAAITQVRQQFQSEMNGANQMSGGTANPNGAPSNPEPNDAAALAHWEEASQDADTQLRDLLGAQGYAAYEQQQYYAWYQPQVLANAEGGNLAISPAAFSSK